MNPPGNNAGSASPPPAGSTPATAGTTPGTAGSMATAGNMSMAGNTGTAGMGTAGMGAPGELCQNMGAPLLDCPMMPPMTGACASYGPCCHRSSNKAKEAALGPNDPLVLEYRINFSLTTNHPKSLGTPLFSNAAVSRYEKEQQSTLWRLTLPRMNGAEVDGMGMFEIGTGRYNCNGTYSFYGDTAAPAKDGISTNAARWAPRKVMVKVDTTKQGADRITPLFTDPAENQITYTPFLTDPQVEYDFELLNQGFKITQADFSGEGRDCIGKRERRQWEYGGEFIIYTPMKGNDVQPIHIVSQPYCSSVAFNVLPDDMKQMRCDTVPRCMPDDEGPCLWVKLPDSLCPESDGDKANWKCHLGSQMNVNNEEGYPATVPCTMEAPTGPLDPAAGATTTGQCCDPLGDADAANTLPACNAYRLVQKFAAAAAEITDVPSNELQKNCLVMP